MGVGGAKSSKGPSLRGRKLGIALFSVFALTVALVGILAMRARFKAPLPARSMERIEPEKVPDVVPGTTVSPEASRSSSIGVVSPEIGEGLNPPPASANYGGRPVILDLSSIQLRVRASTLKGPVPLPVHVSAIPTGWTGPTRGNPYEDLEFTWDFGDPGATRTYRNPVTGATVGTNSDQVGPEAVHVYDTPGNYTITCTARGWNGTAFVTATTTTVVQMATMRLKVRNATTGTYTLKVQQGRPARAARIDSLKTQYLQRPAGHALVPGSTGFFVQGWIRNRFSGNTSPIVSLFATANGKRSWQVAMNNVGVLSVVVGDSAGAATATAATGAGQTPLGDGKWHHVAAWCDVAAGTVNLAVDGTTVATASRTAGMAMCSPADVPFALGAAFDNLMRQTGFTKMDMDEFALWNRPPAAGEIAWLYNGGAGRHWEDVAASSPPAGLATGMLAWWSLDEDTGPFWADSTGNGHALRDYGLSGVSWPQNAGLRGSAPKVHRPGGVATAPLAYNAGLRDIAAAVATAAGLSASEVVPTYPGGLMFDGAQAGNPWTVVPGTTAGGFDGVITLLGDADASQGPSISATAWDTRYPTYYFDSNAAPGGNGTAGTPWNTAAQLVSIMTQNGGPAGMRVLIKAGSDFTMATQPRFFPRAPWLIQKWGEGADPIFRMPAVNLQPQVSNSPGFAPDGFVMDRIRLLSANTCFTTVVGETDTDYTGKGRGIYLLDVEMIGNYFDAARAVVGSEYVDNVGMIGGAISGGGGVPPGGSGNSKNQNLGMDQAQYGAVVAVGISGGGSPPGIGGGIFGHHIYWTVDGGNSLARWIEFGPTAPLPAVLPDGSTNYELSFCIKGSVSAPDFGPPGVTRNGFVVDSSVVTGTGNSFAFGRQGLGTPVGHGFDRLVVQKCRIYRSIEGGFQSLGPYLTDASSATFRDNEMWRMAGLNVEPSSPDFLCDVKYNRNKLHVTTGNPMWKWGIEIIRAKAVEITDNAIQVQGATVLSGFSMRSAVILGSFTDIAALPGTLIDRNRYYFPDTPAGHGFTQGYAGWTITNFAGWRAAGFDPNGSIANLGWVDPANGVFDSATPPPVVTSVAVNPATVTLAGGAALQFAATVVGSGSPSQAVTWSASAGAVSATGLFTAPAATHSVQSITVTATSVADGSKSGVAAASIDKKGKTGQPPLITPKQLQSALRSTPGAFQRGGAVPNPLNRPNSAKWRRSGRYP